MSVGAGEARIRRKKKPGHTESANEREVPIAVDAVLDATWRTAFSRREITCIAYAAFIATGITGHAVSLHRASNAVSAAWEKGDVTYCASVTVLVAGTASILTA